MLGLFKNAFLSPDVLSRSRQIDPFRQTAEAVSLEPAERERDGETRPGGGSAATKVWIPLTYHPILERAGIGTAIRSTISAHAPTLQRFGFNPEPRVAWKNGGVLFSSLVQKTWH